MKNDSEKKGKSEKEHEDEITEEENDVGFKDTVEEDSDFTSEDDAQNEADYKISFKSNKGPIWPNGTFAGRINHWSKRCY